MHLAICDDHIADRKQMERLLGRESDRRASTTGIFYVDSYGSEKSILSTPMIYDAIFMDMNLDGADAIRIADELRKAGTHIPIIFCCGKVNYRLSDRLVDNALFLDKPIEAAALSAVIDELLVMISQRKKKLEFRSVTDTLYLYEEEIVSAYPQDDSRMVLRLSNGKTQIVESSYATFCGNLCHCDSYVSLAAKTVLNMQYIKEISLFRVTLTDGSSARLTLGEAGTLKKILAKYRAGLSGAAT